MGKGLLKKDFGSAPYHEMSLTKVGLSWMPAFISTTDERVSCRKSEDTTYSTCCGLKTERTGTGSSNGDSRLSGVTQLADQNQT